MFDQIHWTRFQDLWGTHFKLQQLDATISRNGKRKLRAEQPSIELWMEQCHSAISEPPIPPSEDALMASLLGKEFDLKISSWLCSFEDGGEKKVRHCFISIMWLPSNNSLQLIVFNPHKKSGPQSWVDLTVTVRIKPGKSGSKELLRRTAISALLGLPTKRHPMTRSPLFVKLVRHLSIYNQSIIHGGSLICWSSTRSR